MVKAPSTVHIVVPSTGAGEYLNFIVNLTTVDGQGAVQGIGNDDHEIVFDNASLGNLSIAEAYYIYGNAPTLIIVRDNTYNICNKYNGFQ